MKADRRCCTTLSRSSSLISGSISWARLQRCDFIADAHAHNKVIGYVPAVEELLGKLGIEPLDEGHVALGKAKDASTLIATAGKGRIWSRETAEDPHI